MGELYTWETLGQITALAGFVYLFVAYLPKPIKRSRAYKLLGVKGVAVLVAYLAGVLIAAALAKTYPWKLPWEVYALAGFNAFPVAAVAGNMHDRAETGGGAE